MSRAADTRAGLGDYNDVQISNRPVLSPKLSRCTPTLSSMLSSRFRHRRLGRGHGVAIAGELTGRAAQQDQGERIVVEQAAVAVGRRGELVDEVGEHRLHRPAQRQSS